MEKIICENIDDTIKTAKAYAKKLKSGDILLLYGDLGAGKTVFSKALIEELTGESDVVSPTFSLCNRYENGDITVCHFDLYRIKSIDELVEIGVEETMYSDAICIFEWPERAESIFPDYAKKIEIKKIDENKREIILC